MTSSPLPGACHKKDCDHEERQGPKKFETEIQEFEEQGKCYETEHIHREFGKKLAGIDGLVLILA